MLSGVDGFIRLDPERARKVWTAISVKTMSFTYALGSGRFNAVAEAEQEFKRLVNVVNRHGIYHAEPPHQTISNNGEIKLVIGPGSHKYLYLFCSAALDLEALIQSTKAGRPNQARLSCDTIGRLPK
jgi:hypothetical protein